MENNNKNSPKVSIITVSWNSENHIRTCIESVLSQEYQNMEYIIVDGKSTDSTVEIIRSYNDKVNKWISEEDAGIYDAMNKGILMSTGDIIGFLNSDDQFYDKMSVAKIACYFDNYDVEATYGNLIFTNKAGQTVRAWKSRSFERGLFAKSWTPAHPTFYCRRILYEKFGLYKTDYRIAADVELMLRFLEVHNVKSGFIDEMLVNMQIGGVSTKGLNSTVVITKELQKAFKENALVFNPFVYLFHKAFKISEYLHRL